MRPARRIWLRVDGIAIPLLLVVMNLGVAEHCSLVTALGKFLFGLDRAANRQGKAAIGGYLGSVSQLTLANLALNSADIGTTLPSR